MLKKNLELYETTNKNIDVYGDIKYRNLQDKYWGMRYFQNTIFFEPFKKISDFCKDIGNTSIEQLKKQKHYTSALTLYIWFIVQGISGFSFIGVLFIDMGAIDSALKLYEIDQTAFSNPNTLSLLASNAIKTGNLEWAVKLTEQLIK
jgi:hypothetical protein